MLILVVIGIKLAPVDMALKGKKTASHLLFNLSLQVNLFSDFRRSVSLLLFVMLLPGGPHSHGILLCQDLCVCLGREMHREEFKIFVDATGKGSISSFCKVRGWLGDWRGVNSDRMWLWSPVLLCRGLFSGRTCCIRCSPQTT